MNKAHIVTCSIKDFFSIKRIIRVTKATTKNDYYYPSNSLELLGYCLSLNDSIIGIEYGKDLVAFTCLRKQPGYFIIEDTAVHPNFWGNGFQVLMWKNIMETVPKKSCIRCTIHPDNIISLNNALSLGFFIIESRIMYGDRVRYVLQAIT